MITDILLDLGRTIVLALVSALPSLDWHLPSAVHSFVGTVRAYDSLLPVTETLVIIAMLGLMVTGFTVWKWSIKLVDWIMDVIP